MIWLNAIMICLLVQLVSGNVKNSLLQLKTAALFPTKPTAHAVAFK